MREILFRGKRTDNGEWVEGLYIVGYFPFDGQNIAYIKQYIERNDKHIPSGEYEVIPETVGQYTGLTDKNGKKIFEGDIVKVPSFDPSVMCITFIEGAFCLANNKGEYAADIHYIHHANNNQTEIIGNIHDNPKLLGEEPFEAESDIGNG